MAKKTATKKRADEFLKLWNEITGEMVADFNEMLAAIVDGESGLADTIRIELDEKIDELKRKYC